MHIFEEMISGSGQLAIGGEPMDIAFTVPKGPCKPEALLPDAQALTNRLVDRSEAKALKAGRKVSCAKGCGACCKQMVPISPPEARHLKAVVKAMPPERAAEVRRRFEVARERMLATGIDPRTDPDADKAAYHKAGMAWFAQGVDCPFLEEGACSIHPVRPLVCREYLVTSPPKLCAQLDQGVKVTQIAVPARVWAIYSRATSADGSLQWMPLTDALHYADNETAPPAKRTGPEWVNAFLGELQKND